MANSKRRCRKCGERKVATELVVRGIQAQCVEPCVAMPTPKRTAVARRPVDDDYRPAILSRDGYQCVVCQTRDNLRVHHINYGGTGVRRNHAHEGLITVCAEHHDAIHREKRVWQPLLRGYIWLLYFEGRRVTIPHLLLELASQR